jgi:predicted restriction endonuclease
MAHLKPRYVLSSIEKMNINNVEFMCKLCHSIYDRGFVGINESGIIEPSKIVNNYRNLSVVKQLGYTYSKYNPNNAIFLNWHYMNIFKK